MQSSHMPTKNRATSSPSAVPGGLKGDEDVESFSILIMWLLFLDLILKLSRGSSMSCLLSIKSGMVERYEQQKTLQLLINSRGF